MEVWIEKQFFIPSGCLLFFDFNGNLTAFQEGNIITLVEDSEDEEAGRFKLINRDSVVHRSWIRKR